MGEISISVDARVLAAAHICGARAGRSGAEQFAWWARVGREFEESSTVRDHAIAEVLAGAGDYDELTAAEQIHVRVAWAEAVADTIAGLDLAAEFEAAGESWSEADSEGHLVIRNPTVTPLPEADRGLQE